MDVLFWILFVIAGVALYAAFGQHRNKLFFDVASVIQEKESAFADGEIRQGWIGLSQHVFFKKKDGIGSAHVIAILAGQKHLRVAKKGERVRLVIAGKNLEELHSGSLLVTSKKNA